jgi:tetratricopeptide (TPR) repeat protein
MDSNSPDPPLPDQPSRQIDTGGGSFVAGGVNIAGGAYVGRDQTILKIDYHYYLTANGERHSLIPLHSILDPPAELLPLLSAGRTEELAQLHSWYEAVLADIPTPLHLEMQQALSYYEQALPLHRAVGDRGGEAATLSSIGYVYLALSQIEQARQYWQQALALFEAVQSPHAGSVRQWLASLDKS